MRHIIDLFMNFVSRRYEIEEEKMPKIHKVVANSFVLIHFNRVVTTNEAWDALDSLGLRPLQSDELEVFIDDRPDRPYRFPIVPLYPSGGSILGILEAALAIETLSGDFVHDKNGAIDVGKIQTSDGRGWRKNCRFLAKEKT